MTDGMQVCSRLWLAFFVLWMFAALRTKRAVERATLPRRLYYTIPVVLGYYCMFSSYVEVPWWQYRYLPRSPEVAIAGTLITGAGLAFAIWARVHLGRNWSSAVTIKEQHQLIRSGPYRFVRHPIYTGLIVAMMGIALANGKVRGALGVLLVWFGFLLKSRMEEEFMVRAFGAEYADYRTTTGALFPRIGA
jgi:protein-S-isoprenylcysteine O-methyltransferase Ste14